MIRSVKGLWPVLALLIFVFGLAAAPAAGQSIKSISGWSGTTLRIDFGGLERVGRGFRPRQMHQEIEYDQAPAELRQQADAAAQTSNEPSPEVLKGRALVDQGMKAFGESRWAETIEALRQALAFLPNDPAIGKTLTMAQMALHYEEMAAKADQEAARRAAEDSVRVGIDLERLSDALSALRLEASEALVDQGRFESAVGLSERTDFLFDSSVVDLRQARQGIVNFEALRPPKSPTGELGFAPPPRRAEAPAVQKARRLLDDPAVESVMFFERMGEAISYKPSAEERQDRFSDPVTRAVADRLGIPLGSATPEERAYVAQKTRQVWDAYDRNKAAQAAATSDVAQKSVEAFKELIGRLESQGILKPGENVLAKEKADPTFRALMRSEVKAIVLEDNVGRRETARSSFDKLLGEVASVLDRRGTR